MIKELLTEKLRPKRLEHLILPQRIKTALQAGVSHHLLLYGPPGTGKTSAARVVAAGHPTKYINVSDESSVEIIRTKINDFCSTASVMDGFEGGKAKSKVVILDEIEGGSDQFMKALRGVMEKFTNTRFIATTNHLNKLADPIISRFDAINFDFENSEEERAVRAEWTTRVGDIMTRLGIATTDKSLNEFVKLFFPDMRRALNKIQGMANRGVKELSSAEMVNTYEFEPMWNKIVNVKTSNPYDNFCIIMQEYSGKAPELMEAAAAEFVNWLHEKHPQKSKCIPEIIIETAKHLNMAQVIDPIVALQSLFFTLQRIILKTEQ